MKIYNSLSKQKEEFRPVVAGKVSIYACGPTVYDYFHVGNARCFVVFDVIRRYFEYKKYAVTFVQNITDIDDKIIYKSWEEKRSAKDVATEYTKAYMEDRHALGIKDPDHQPKATDYVGKMIALIIQLIKAGFAYDVNGDVYFRVTKSVDYGKLSGKVLDDLQVGVRVAANLQKENPADFTLWKKAKDGEPAWESPWGEGRPGWHTECVAMSRDLLLTKGVDTFDIHGGGADLVFPHHENEIAQAECLSGKPMANYWMHNGYLNINGEKMSKSQDNFFRTRDVLKKYDAEALRFFFLSKSYRSPIDFNEEIVIESAKAIENFYAALKAVDYLSVDEDNMAISHIGNIKYFENAMDDDFNTAIALSILFSMAKFCKDKNHPLETRQQHAVAMVRMGKVLGFFQNLAEKLKEDLSPLTGDLIELFISYRENYKKEKNWEMADKIRNDLSLRGVHLMDTAQGCQWEIRKKS